MPADPFNRLQLRANRQAVLDYFRPQRESSDRLPLSLTATTDTASTQNFELQAGAIYYMEAGVVPREHLFQPSLSVMFDLQGQTAIQNLERLRYYE
jgi:hypothetical protein